MTDQDVAVAHYYLWKFLGTVSVDVDDDYALMWRQLKTDGHWLRSVSVSYTSDNYSGKFYIISAQAEHTYHDCQWDNKTF